MMQDSDWDDALDPSQKTIFSESHCRLNRGWDAEVCFTLNGALARFSGISPVIGYRYQYFYFTTYDGFQADIDGSSGDLPGDGIDFIQSFHHLCFGAALKTRFNEGLFLGRRILSEVFLQFDYAVVRAQNEDLHLLRVGDRVTREHTRGHCWHGALKASFRLGEYLRARFEGNFKRIITTGSHNLSNPAFGIDFTFDGAKVWSDQLSVAAAAEILF